jgi:pSer/pThr/pTyr-binding forkhead associated (FHA) protein
MPICSHCGRANAEDAKFCSNCGQRLAEDAVTDVAPEGAETPPVETTATITMGVPAKPDEDQAALNDADAAAVDALPSGSALLVVQRGPGAGSRYLLDTDLVTAGRHPESDIFLDDITVSRRHVEFRRSEGGYTVHDVGSLNGTYVNRDRIDDIALQNGDEVRIGKFRLIYFASDAAGS